jgi:hypothetical protein
LSDIVDVVTIVSLIIGAIGGIPQIIRWLGKHPHLKIRNIAISYNPEIHSVTTYVYLEGGAAHVVNSINTISFHVENTKPRFGFFRRTHATGIVVAASMSNPKTGVRIYNFSKDDDNNILAPGELTSVRQQIQDHLQLPEYRVYVSAVSKEGDSAKVDTIVKVRRIETLR